MNIKKGLTLLATTIALLAVILVGFGVWTLSKLPSTFEIKEAVTPAGLKPAPELPPQDMATQLPAQNPEGDVESKAVETAPAPTQSKEEKVSQLGLDVLRDDFANEQVPLLDSCKSLSAASESRLLDDDHSPAKYFFESLAAGRNPDKKDPLVESAAPVLRYVFRAPGMKEAFELITQAQETKDQSLLEKAEFYGNLLRAGAYLKEHREDVDVLLQRTYNMHVLAKAVAQKPELARDSATLSFCDQIEKSVNHGSENYDPAAEAQEVSKFLSEVGVSPGSVGFDPNYRSQVKLNLSSSQVRLNDTWIVQLFAKDIERANKAKVQ
ncbi:hypothetical protein D3C87_257030 [compost metagenome]